MQKRKYSAMDGKWITVNAGEGKGQPVYLGGDGLIRPGGPGSDPATEPTFTGDINPTSQFGSAVLQVARQREVAPDDLADAARFVLEEKQGHARRREEGKASARQLTGLTAGTIGAMENKGLDFASGHKWPGIVGQRMRHIDTFAQEIAKEYPELEVRDAADLWDLLREGAERIPQPSDPEILAEAADLVKQNQNYPELEESPVPFRRGGLVERYRRWRNER